MKLTLTPRAMDMMRHTVNGKVPDNGRRALGILRQRGLVQRNSRQLTMMGRYWAEVIARNEWSNHNAR